MSLFLIKAILDDTGTELYRGLVARPGRPCGDALHTFWHRMRLRVKSVTAASQWTHHREPVSTPGFRTSSSIAGAGPRMCKHYVWLLLPFALVNMSERSSICITQMYHLWMRHTVWLDRQLPLHHQNHLHSCICPVNSHSSLSVGSMPGMQICDSSLVFAGTTLAALVWTVMASQRK